MKHYLWAMAAVFILITYVLLVLWVTMSHPKRDPVIWKEYKSAKVAGH